MSVLDQLHFVTRAMRISGYDAVTVRRSKFAAALGEQLRLLRAASSDEPYRRTRTKRRRDLETDELFDVERQLRVSPWWRLTAGGEVEFALRYGAERLIVKDGNSVLMVPSVDDLERVIPILRNEVLAGGLDEALAAAAFALNVRFQKRRKPSVRAERHAA